jgi:hypothetical protein
MKISQLWDEALRAARLSWEGGGDAPATKKSSFQGPRPSADKTPVDLPLRRTRSEVTGL